MERAIRQIQEFLKSTEDTILEGAPEHYSNLLARRRALIEVLDILITEFNRGEDND